MTPCVVEPKAQVGQFSVHGLDVGFERCSVQADRTIGFYS